MMTRSQGEALVALLHQLRRDDWDLPGIRAAVTKAQALGSATDVATAACRVAGNPQAKSPGLIAHPGAHWQGTTVAARPTDMHCPEHPTQPAGHCRTCEQAAASVDHGAHADATRLIARKAVEADRAAKRAYHAAMQARRAERDALKEARA